jgi:hypothetical protein
MDTIAYVVTHDYEAPHSLDNGKLIGVYATQADAEEAVARMRTLPGFSKYPDGFVIDKYPVNKDHWTSGFFTPGKD